MFEHISLGIVSNILQTLLNNVCKIFEIIPAKY